MPTCFLHLLLSAISVSVSASGAEGDTILITARPAPLGDTRKPDGKDFTPADPEHPTQKELEFGARENKKELVLEVQAGEVGQDWKVKLNGRELATLWRPPFQIDVTEVLKTGRNELEVRVTNLWVNRLIGDEQLPLDREWRKVERRNGWALAAYPDWLQRGERSPTGRVTFATWKHYEADAPLLPSGLLGPVAIRMLVRVPMSDGR